MNNFQIIAVKFLKGGWRIFKIANKPAPNGDRPTFLNLDEYFTDRNTSIRFAGYSQSGRLLYKEMNLPRKVLQTSTQTIDFYNCDDLRQQ